MMLCRGLLVDRDIRAALRSGELMVSDLDDAMVRPAAVSLRMGDKAYVLSSQTDVDALDPPHIRRRGLASWMTGGRGPVPGEVMLLRGRRVRQSYRAMPANHSRPEWSFESRLGEAEALRSG